MASADRDAQLSATSEVVKQALQSAEHGDWQTASRHLDEAAAAYSAITPGEDAPYFAVGASISEGHGQLSLRLGKLDAALPHLERGLALRAKQRAAGSPPPLLSIPVGLVNLTGACHRLGRLDDALQHNTAALEHLRPLSEPPARLFFAAATEARGNLLAQMGRHAEGREQLSAAATLTAELSAAGIQGAAQLQTEVLVAHARVALAAGAPDDAMALVRQASDLAWDRYEADPQGDRDAISHFVAAQMNLVGFAEAAGRFAEGEDALKVLRLVGPDPRVLARGKAFYEKLRSLEDEALEAGNLPRDEVEESYAQLATIAREAAKRAAAASA